MSNSNHSLPPDRSESVQDVPGSPGLNRAATVVTSAALGGAVSGALVGAVAGPVGTAIGAAVGAIAAGFGGNAIAASVDAEAEDAYWRSNFRERPYVDAEAPFERYAPAYAHGVQAHVRHPGRAFDEIDAELEHDWPRSRGASTLDWSSARPASRDAWYRVRGDERDVRDANGQAPMKPLRNQGTGGSTVQAPKAVGKAPIAPADPAPGAGEGLPLPHERDESVGDVAAEPNPVIAQAAKDIAAGQVDTDMRNSGGQTDAQREKLLQRERR